MRPRASKTWSSAPRYAWCPKACRGRRSPCALPRSCRTPRTKAASGSTRPTSSPRCSMAKTVQSVRIVGNVGLGILGDPTRGDRQNDVLTYGLSFARAVPQAAELVGEVNGRADTRAGDPPPGTESRSTVRFGGRYTIGTLRADAGDSLRHHVERSRRRLCRRLHLRLQRLPGPLMAAVRVGKAHAYGNDFLLVPRATRASDAAGLARAAVPSPSRDRRRRPDLLRAARPRRDDAAVQRGRQPVGTLRQRAAVPRRARRRARSRSTPGATVTVDTDAGVKTLHLLERRGDVYTFRAALGRADRRPAGADSGARRDGDGVGAEHGQPAVRRARPAAGRRRASTRLAPRCRRTRCFPRAPTSSSRTSRRPIACAS